MNGWWMYSLLTTLCLFSGNVWAAAAPDTLVSAAAQRLQVQEEWGEAVIRGGATMTIRVDAVRGDSILVRERVGPLYLRPAVYALHDLVSITALDSSPRRVVPVSARASMPLVLGMEVLIPGAGYLYVGEQRTGLALATVAAAAVGTAVATGKAGAAGWAPAIAWLKVASLVNLRDQVRAINGNGADGGSRGGGGPAVTPGSYLRNLSLGLPTSAGRPLRGAVLRAGF